MSGHPERFGIDVLGPLRVTAPDGADLTPGGALPRRLLALLVLRRGHTVTVDAAVELLWPTGGPHDPVAALHSHVARLRRVLPGAIVSTPTGYRLDPQRVEVDADGLAAALADPEYGPDVVAPLLERWHGPAFPDLEDCDDARAESAHFAELRCRAREFLAERRLAAGRTDGLATELRALSDEHPLRERPRALLMDALTATGRHADALAVYDDFRRLLAAELAVAPSPALAARHQRLLGGESSAAWSPTGVLPMPATTLIGREDLLERLESLTDECRLLTLVGPGGVGKTRLLLALGHRLADRAPGDPVVLCELGRVDAAGVEGALATALRIDVRPGVPLVERIAGVLRDDALTLLVDNCEHVLDPVAEFVERATARCRGLRVVTTSRERLRVPGEFVRHIPPLDCAGPDAPAVRLFLDRARAVTAGPVPGDDTDRIAAIVARLDGLPLAIELAAARMFSHDLSEIADGLARPLEFLSSGYRSSDRHGSLAATVAWSFTLLDAALARAFRALSVFGGPFDPAAAAAVCAVPEPTAQRLLDGLVEQSLVMRYPGRRYVLLETLRAFGRDRLAERGEATVVGGRHAHHLVDWARAAHERLAADDSASIGEIDDAVGELRRASEWLLAHDEPATAADLVAALFDYGVLRLRPDVLGWAVPVADALADSDAARTATMLAAAAYAAWMTGDVERAGDHSARALEIARATGDPVAVRVLSARGVYELFAGRLDLAAEWYGSADDAAARAEDHAYRLIPRGTHIMVRGYLADPATADLARQLAEDIGADTSPYAAYAWYCAGEAVLDTEPEVARTRLDAAIRLAERTDTALVTGVATASRASLEVRAGRWHEAARAYAPLIEHWRRVGMWAKQWVMMRAIAQLFDGLDRPEDAALLEGAIRAATTGQRAAGSDDVALDELAARLRARLGDERFDSARRRGAALDDDLLIAHVLDAL